MSKKIYLSPSSQPANMYAVGNVSEQTQCRKIASALKKELDSCGFTTYAGLSGTMYTRAAESDKWGVDLHMPIHTNAFDGKVAGLRIMVNKLGGEAEQIAKAIMDTLAPITPGTSDGISAMPSLYEIKATDAICVYLEVGFHDNPTEAKWIIEHTEEIAVAICKGLCNHYGVKYAAGQATEPAKKEEPKQEAVQPEKNLYRVRKAWNDAKSQLFAGTLEGAKRACTAGYKVYDKSGKVVYTPAESAAEGGSKAYTVRVKISNLYIRKGPGKGYNTNGFIKPGVYTIVEEKSGAGSVKGWGKLKSGAGWVSLDYCTKL